MLQLELQYLSLVCGCVSHAPLHMVCTLSLGHSWSLSIRPPSLHSSQLLLCPTPPPTGEAILNRVSPEYVVLTPPSALELAVRASGAFETLTWYYNGAGSGLFSLSNFGQVLNVDSTVVEDAGEYVAQMQGTYQLEVVFQVQPFSERNCFWH